MTTSMSDIQNRLWDVADQLRANSELTSAEYKTPVLGLVFLRFADERFGAVQKEEIQMGEYIHKTQPISKGHGKRYEEDEGPWRRGLGTGTLVWCQR